MVIFIHRGTRTKYWILAFLKLLCQKKTSRQPLFCEFESLLSSFQAYEFYKSFCPRLPGPGEVSGGDVGEHHASLSNEPRLACCSPPLLISQDMEAMTDADDTSQTSIKSHHSA